MEQKIDYIIRCTRFPIVIVICPVCGKGGTIIQRCRHTLAIQHRSNGKKSHHCYITNHIVFYRRAETIFNTVCRIYPSTLRQIVRGEELNRKQHLPLSN